MGGVGGLNPISRVVGGAPSLAEKVHAALRAAVGGRRGGGAGKLFWESPNAIEDAWRFAKARAIARVLGLMEQAAQEFFPQTASYNVDQWEESLGLLPAPSLHERRLQIAAVWTDEVDASIPGLQADLRARFGAGITVSYDSDANRTQARFHKWLADRTGVVPFGPRASSPAPGLSTSYRLRVQYPGTHTEKELQAVRDRLNLVLPSWVDYTVFESKQFVLGTSKLGHTALTW